MDSLFEISLLITLLFLFSLTPGVSAQDTELPDPGLTPNSPFYFLETMVEGIGTFFTFGNLKKAERYAKLVAERVAEAKAVMEKGKPELVEKTLERYENQLGKALFRAEKARTEGENIDEVAQTITDSVHKHFVVLEEILEKAPEEAKPAIKQAMTVSTKKGLEKIMEELIIKDAFNMDFKSFKALEDFCLESGGPSDQCSSLETRCREAGVTTPDECFHFISTATLEAYHSIELKAVPLSEKEMGEGEGKANENDTSKIRIEGEETTEIPKEKIEGVIIKMPKEDL